MSQQLQADTEPGGSTSRAGSPEGFLLPPGESNSQQRGSSLSSAPAAGAPQDTVPTELPGRPYLTHDTWSQARALLGRWLGEAPELSGQAPNPPAPSSPVARLRGGHPNPSEPPSSQQAARTGAHRAGSKALETPGHHRDPERATAGGELQQGPPAGAQLGPEGAGTQPGASGPALQQLPAPAGCGASRGAAGDTGWEGGAGPRCEVGCARTPTLQLDAC